MMRRKRIEILLIVVAALAMSAGVVATLLASRLVSTGGHADGSATTAPTVAPPASFERTLADELNLRPDQREAMREIWEGVRERVHKTFDDAQALQHERDEAMIALLNPEQRQKFAKISQDYASRFDALTKKRDQTFDEAVEKTKKILDGSQRQRYEEILKSHVRRGPPQRIPPPPGPPLGTVTPATAPSAD
jgi:Spy/CpxP family protein refolding chaperone